MTNHTVKTPFFLTYCEKAFDITSLFPPEILLPPMLPPSSLPLSVSTTGYCCPSWSDALFPGFLHELLSSPYTSLHDSLDPIVFNTSTCWQLHLNFPPHLTLTFIYMPTIPMYLTSDFHYTTLFIAISSYTAYPLLPLPCSLQHSILKHKSNHCSIFLKTFQYFSHLKSKIQNSSGDLQISECSATYYPSLFWFSSINCIPTPCIPPLS
jgi:hypothetical protein